MASVVYVFESAANAQCGSCIDFDACSRITTAVKLLAVCETNGTELRNCPAYIREWVSRERAQRSAELSDLEAGASEDIQDV
jgi:Domain of unknown function (DUF4259)